MAISPTGDSIDSVELGKEAIVTDHVEALPKTSASGITLVPQPTDDPRDPLNWPSWRKYLTLIIVCLSAFTGTVQAVGNVSSVFQQGALYNKSAIAITYSVSAATAGLCAGPLFWSPLSQKYGRVGCILWATVITLVCCIWAAVSTGPNDYISFVMSRLFGCLAASCATTVGAGFVTDIYFLHQRGKCFAFYAIAILLGTIAGPTFSGFIVGQGLPWPVEYWYNVGLEGLCIVLIVLFLEETGFTRPGKPLVYPRVSDSRMARLIDAHFFRKPIVVQRTAAEMLGLAIMPFRIGLNPVGIMGGIYLMVTFGWSVAVNNLLAVFLQSPVAAGGYGFTPNQNAEFSFAAWMGVIGGQVFGYYFNDRIPLWVCRRAGGIWKPEHRLYPLWFPGLITLPIGLGLFGAAIQYHLQYMVAAVGFFLIIFSSNVNVPVIVNYEIECFTRYPVEAATIMNFYRTILGIAIPFFIDQWEAAVDVGWVFGMAAFFSLMAFGLTVILMLWGQNLRHWSLGVGTTEEGTKIITSKADIAGGGGH